MSEEDEHVTKAELKDFAQTIGELMCEKLGDFKEEINALTAELRQPKAAAFYRCGEEGCEFVTEDAEAFVKHIVAEEIQKITPEKPKSVHSSPEEYLDCPECFPKFERAMLARGFEKPEAKRDSGLNI